MTEQILYTKYSNDRAPQYCIATDIIQKKNEKVVRKRAVGEKSISHVRQLLEKEQQLKNVYQNSKFQVNGILDSKENYVDFEYVEGTSYEALLDYYLEREDFEELKNQMQLFFDEYEKCMVEEFQTSEEFEMYFGDVQVPKRLNAMPYGNIDLIFQNVLVDEEGNWNLIDYEWAVECLVPLRYIQYRSIYLYVYSQSKRSILIQNHIFDDFGFSEEEMQCFEQMEKNFQAAIKAGHMQLGDYYQMMGNPAMDSAKLFFEAERNLIQVYYDKGDGFSEDNKRCYTEFPLRFCVDDSIKRVKVIPMYDRGIIKIKSIMEDTGKVLSYETNGKLVGESCYFYNDVNPEIIISDINATSHTICLDFEIESVGVETVILFEDMMYRIGTEIESIHNSMSWKITKPLRVLVDMITRKK